MKKTLMVLSFAMCASFAFAQTGAVSNKCSDMSLAGQAQLSTTRPVDYKASIFTKTETVLYSVDFSANDTASLTFGRSAVLHAGDSVGNTRISRTAAHNESDNFSVWQFIRDTQYVATNDFVNTYPNMYNSFRSNIMYYMGPNYTGLTNNGFFLMSMVDQRSMTAGAFNAYLQLPTITIADPTAVNVIDVDFFQYYSKYYDTCYIDYKLNNHWYAVEINVDGVDVDVNSTIRGEIRYTLPLSLASQSAIDIRFRWFNDGSRGNAYGYVWAIDHVKVIAGESDRWNHYSESVVNGGFGTMPQNMVVPFTWSALVANTGVVDQTDATITVNHQNAQHVQDVVFTKNHGTITAGRPDSLVALYTDEQGFYNTARDAGYQGWYGYTSTYRQTTIPSTYQGRGLPTNTLGLNFSNVAISTTTQEFVYDTFAYQVVPGVSRVNPEVEESSNLDSVFVWAYDNGVIPSQSSYTKGFTDRDENGNHFVTDAGHYTSRGYTVQNRYTTGNVIPQGWRILGVEMIVATNFDEITDFDGTEYNIVLQRDEYSTDSTSVNFRYVATGVDDATFTVSGANQINNLKTGVIKPGESYKAIDIFFPEQPELEPNTSYRIGYQLNSNATGNFALASPLYRYATTERVEQGSQGQDSSVYDYAYYLNTPAMYDYTRQYMPGIYDVTVYDDETHLWAGDVASIYQPMIRMLVGPYKEMDKVAFTPTCEDGQYSVVYQRQYVCDQFEVIKGYDQTVYFYAEGEFEFDKIIIDGQEVSYYNSRTGQGDRNLGREEVTVRAADSSEIGTRYVYWYTFENVSAPHTMSAHVVALGTSPIGPSQSEGISTVSDNVKMRLFPNPATSQVQLSIEGVSGMINCNIIDMSGRVVYNANIDAESVKAIDLKNVPAGAYFVRITNDNFSKIEKLIVR